MTESHDEKLRLLREDDIPAAFQLSAQAGWNQTEDDWRMLLQLSPEGCLAVEINGQLAATTTLICYGRRLAWIGMVLTQMEYRRQGLAKRLLAATLTLADRMEIKTTKLDASAQGMPLYEQLGFHSEQKIERWSRPGENVAQLPAIQSIPGKTWSESDTGAFGADRSRLLNSLAQHNPPISVSRSYLLSRAGRVSAYLGPCVSKNPEIARGMIGHCIQNTNCCWSWDLLPKNQDAVKLARELGFSPQRYLVRMARGKLLPQNESLIYAIAGFELG